MDTKEIKDLINLLTEEEKYKKAFNKQLEILENEHTFLSSDSYPYLKALAGRLIDIQKQMDVLLEKVRIDIYSLPGYFS